jgi:phosphoglycolate phosphatase-like HAD superfamily hydrolase
VIIGDTPNDVLCGRHLGVRAVAVATGRFPVEELKAHAPDRTFTDFRNTAEAVSGILGAPERD